MRFSDSKLADKLHLLINKVHFGMWTKPYTAVKCKKNEPIFLTIKGWGTFSTPIEIFWQKGINNNRTTKIDWDLDFSTEGEHKKIVNIGF